MCHMYIYVHVPITWVHIRLMRQTEAFSADYLRDDGAYVPDDIECCMRVSELCSRRIN